MIRMNRIQFELSSSAYIPPGIALWNEDGKIFANILAGEDTPYKDQMFKLMIDPPEMYPFYPPDIHFITPIYHPNIDTAGRICLDYLKMPPQGSWNPTITLGALLMTIKQLLAEPNPDDPLMPEIATEYKFNRVLFCFKAKDHLKKFDQKNSKKSKFKRVISNDEDQFSDNEQNLYLQPPSKKSKLL